MGVRNVNGFQERAFSSESAALMALGFELERDVLPKVKQSLSDVMAHSILNSVTLNLNIDLVSLNMFISQDLIQLLTEYQSILLVFEWVQP